MKTFMLLCALLLTSTATCSPSITINALNIKWFGLDGSMKNDLGTEKRTTYIKKYLQQNKLLSDVMVFEEIVDVPLLEEKVLDNKYDCESYDNNNPKHQHVVICVKPTYQFEPEDGTGYAYQEVSLEGKVRPAVHGILTVRGKKIHIFGVHLKAAPPYSNWRLKQAQILADYIQHSVIPVLIIGDFNTYGDDAEKISNIFKEDNLMEINTPEDYSWATTSEKYPNAKLDRAWITDSVKVEKAHIIGPCNGNGDLESYNKKISDHCTLSVTLEL